MSRTKPRSGVHAIAELDINWKSRCLRQRQMARTVWSRLACQRTHCRVFRRAAIRMCHLRLHLTLAPIRLLLLLLRFQRNCNLHTTLALCSFHALRACAKTGFVRSWTRKVQNTCCSVVLSERERAMIGFVTMRVAAHGEYTVRGSVCAGIRYIALG